MAKELRSLIKIVNLMVPLTGESPVTIGLAQSQVDDYVDNILPGLPLVARTGGRLVIRRLERRISYERNQIMKNAARIVSGENNIGNTSFWTSSPLICEYWEGDANWILSERGKKTFERNADNLATVAMIENLFFDNLDEPFEDMVRAIDEKNLIKASGCGWVWKLIQACEKSTSKPRRIDKVLNVLISGGADIDETAQKLDYYAHNKRAIQPLQYACEMSASSRNKTAECGKELIRALLTYGAQWSHLEDKVPPKAWEMISTHPRVIATKLGQIAGLDKRTSNTYRPSM